MLHGKGNGILRHMIREYLSGIPEVKNYRDEHIERGEDGKTLVSLK
jgi:DNA mismatch repair protein MutS2